MQFFKFEMGTIFKIGKNNNSDHIQYKLKPFFTDHGIKRKQSQREKALAMRMMMMEN